MALQPTYILPWQYKVKLITLSQNHSAMHETLLRKGLNLEWMLNKDWIESICWFNFSKVTEQRHSRSFLNQDWQPLRLFIRRRIDNQIYSGSVVRPVTQLINWQLMKSITLIIYCINNMQNITHWEKNMHDKITINKDHSHNI